MIHLKPILTLVLLISSLSVFSQKTNYNLEDDFIAEGFDVVSYFDQTPKEGLDDYVFTYDGAKFKFSSLSNLEKFKTNPVKYIPQYGGWCAYAMSTKGEKVNMDPETYEIRNGKLFLFYNAFFYNTYESWLEEKPNQLILKGDKHWTVLKQ